MAVKKWTCENSNRKIHDYLAIKSDYSQEGKVIIDMIDYINSMIEEFPCELESKCKCPWTERLLNVDTSLQKLDKTKSDTFIPLY